MQSSRFSLAVECSHDRVLPSSLLHPRQHCDTTANNAFGGHSPPEIKPDRIMFHRENQFICACRDCRACRRRKRVLWPQASKQASVLCLVGSRRYPDIGNGISHCCPEGLRTDRVSRNHVCLNARELNGRVTKIYRQSCRFFYCDRCDASMMNLIELYIFFFREF